MRKLLLLDSTKKFRAKKSVRGLLGLVVIGLLSTSIVPTRARAAEGDLDPSFGIGGEVTTSFFDAQAEAITVLQQSDGKIIAVGFVFIPTSGLQFALARYNTDGSLDISFGSGGKVITSFFGGSDLAFAAALQPDGKIVAAGTVTDTNGNLNFGLARYNTDGSLDLSFGSGGKVVTNFSGSLSEAFAVAIQSDGKIIAGGITRLFTPNPDFALVRYNTDGSLDNTFGVGGQVTTDFFGSADNVNALIIQPDGKIVAGGRADMGAASQGGDFALARYNADGSLDLSFGVGGKVTTDFFGSIDELNDLALQSDGKIVAAGVAFISNPGDNLAALARYNTNGSLDPSFGPGGQVTSVVISPDSQASAVTLTPGGKIVIAGTTSTNRFFVAQFNDTGSPDSSFGTGGVVVVDFSSVASFALDVLVQPDGKIVAAGHVGDPRGFALARLLGAEVDDAFDLCIQDDSNGNMLRLNSTNGEYQFINCSGFVLSGTGSLTTKGGITTLQDFASDRRLLARIDRRTNKATATLNILAQRVPLTIIDRNIANDTCSCR